MFYKGFFIKWRFYFGLGWGKSITLYNHHCYLISLGLPIPIVAIAAGIGNEHYGSENGLVY